MASFDHALIAFFNQFVGVYPFLDKGMVYLSNDGFIRGGILAVLLWWAWFKREANPDGDRDRQIIAATLITAPVSITVARLLTAALPYRLRPISDLTNGFHFPAATVNWSAWSSFPSDHAILYFAVTGCLFYVSSVLGWIALADSVVLMSLPRVYLGIHYPSDLLGGAAIGVALAIVANRQTLREYLGTRALRWARVHPSSFYALFFLVTYEITSLFYYSRAIPAIMGQVFMHFMQISGVAAK